MIKRYIKKPVGIEAIQWDGTTFNEIVEFVDKECLYVTEHGAPCQTNFDRYILKLDTLEGVMNISPYDYIIKGIKGEFYPCKPDIFEESYEVCHDERLQAKLEEYTELESEGNMEEYRSCDNCKHEYVEPSKYPCSICKYGDGTEDNWNTDKPKNYIKEFMHDNDLELGEEFEVDGEKGWFMDNYFLHVKGQYENRCRELLISLLSGKLKPIKLEPKVDWGKVEKGTLIEVSDDGETWCERKYLGMFNGFYMTLAIAFNSPMGWKYARKIENK